MAEHLSFALFCYKPRDPSKSIDDNRFNGLENLLLKHIGLVGVFKEDEAYLLPAKHFNLLENVYLFTVHNLYLS